MGSDELAGSGSGTTRRDRVRPLALAWLRAVRDDAYVPLAPSHLVGRFEALAAEALAVVLSPDLSPAEAQARARALGESLVAARLSSARVLERTVALLAGELLALPGGDPTRVGVLLAGLAGGFTSATAAVILNEQEDIRQAYTVALRAANEQLEAHRARLEQSNAALNRQIVERERAEAAARMQAARLEYMHQVSLEVLSAGTLDAVVQTAVRYVRATVPCIYLGVSVFDAAQREATIFHSSDDAHFARGARYPITMTMELATLRTGRFYYIADVRAHDVQSPGYQRMVAIGGRSLLVVPLGSDANFSGALSIITADVREFTPDEVGIAQELANLIAVAIQDRRLLEAEQEARRREATLRELATNLSLSLDLDEYLRRLLDRLDELVPALSSSVVLLQDGNPVLVSKRPPQDIPVEWFQLIMARNSDSMGWVFRNGRARVIPDTTAVPGWVVVPGFETVHSWLGVPLLVRGACIGVLTLDREAVDAFAPHDEEVALAFATQAAVAIENARLYGEAQARKDDLERRVQKRTQELNALYGITAVTVANPDLATVLRRALELALEAFDCSSGAIYLNQSGRHGLRLADCLDDGGRDAAQRLADPATADDLRRRLAAESPPWIGSNGNLPRHIYGEAVGSVAAAPLRARGRSLGILCLLSDRPDRFTAAAQLLTTIADQIGAAVENIELRGRTRQAAIIEERERLARDLHDAVTQAIYGIGLFANAARDAARAGDLDKVDRHVVTVQQASRHALKEMRLLLFELRTEDLARLGLAGALNNRLAMVERRAEIAADVQVRDMPPLPVAIEETFYRVALEALNNALRHAQARRVVINLRAHDHHLLMTIQDNGVGFRLREARAKGGMGLSSMESRVRSVGGSVKFISRIGEGTRVEVRAPLPPGDE